MSLRRALGPSLLAIALLGAPQLANAACTTVTSICNAVDLVKKCCGATACSIDAALIINGPTCDLDFGARKVTLTGSLSIGSNTVSIEARSLSLKGPVNAVGATTAGGGTLNVVLSGGEDPALTMGGSGVIDLSAFGRGGGSISITADGAIQTQGQGFKANGLDASGSGGSIEVTTTAGAVSIGDLGGVSATGLLAMGGSAGDGGTIRVESAGDLVLGQDRIISVSAGGVSEGLIDLSAGAKANFKNASTISADGLPGSGASGGSVEILAAAIDGLGNISAIGGTGGAVGDAGGGDGGEIDLEARTGHIMLQRTTGGLFVDSAAGGDGGSISLSTDSPTNAATPTDGAIQVGATLSAQGIGPDDSFGGGGSIEVDALGEIQVTRPINANGAGGGIGEVDLNALRDINVTATVSGSDPGGGGDLSIGGHSIFVRGNLQFQGGVNSSGGANGGTAALVAESDVLVAHLFSVDVSGSGGVEGGRIDVLAGRNVFVEDGGSLVASGGGFGGFGGQIAVTAGDGGEAGDVTINGNVFAKGSSLSGSSSIDLEGCTVTIAGTVDSRGDTTSVNTIVGRSGVNVAGQGHVQAATTNALVLGGGFVQSPLATVTPAATIDQRTPCTAVGVPANCLMPCPNCGNGKIEFPETCDPGASTDRCGTHCAHCQMETCGANPCLQPDCDAVGGCVGLPKPAGTACDDNDKCNGHETCGAGTCLKGLKLVCDDENPCTEDTCDAATGCGHSDKTGPGIAGCDDGNPCTGAETCGGGTCSAGTPVQCTAPKVCDRSSGACSIIPCTPPDTTPCVDGNPCTADNCNVNHCENPLLPNNTPCADSDVCNGAETCQAGHCTDGTALDCDDHKFCTTDTCDGILGCQHTPSADADCCEVGDACNDGDACTTDACTNHHCTNTPIPNCCQTPTDCDDGNPCDGVETCVSDRCQPGTNLPNNTPCDDDTICNGREVCSGGVCNPGNALNCADDHDVCTEEFCDPANGCQHRDIPDCCHDATECDDNNACTTDACASDTHVCTHISADPTCKPCQIDTDCDPDGRCAGQACKPDKTCTAVDLPCDDHNSHTSDRCVLDPQLAPVCTNACLDNLACDDGKACNGEERCQSGNCVAGTAPTCDDHDLCTDDGCAEARNGCFHTPKLSFASVSCRLDGIDAILAGAAPADVATKTKNALAKQSTKAHAKLQQAIAADQVGNAKKRLKMLKGTSALGRSMQRAVTKGIRTHKISEGVGETLQQLLTGGLDALGTLMPPK